MAAAVAAKASTTLLKNAAQKGASLPMIGLGTWKSDVGKTRDAVISAVRDGGYMHIHFFNGVFSWSAYV